MSLFDAPFLAKLAGTIDKRKPVLVYNNQTTAVLPADPLLQIIDVAAYDAMLVRVTGSGTESNLSLRIIGSGGVQNEFLDVYDYFTKQKMPNFGSTNYLPGIQKPGNYIVPLTGLNTISMPLYSLSSSGGVNVRINLMQTFGGFTPDTPVTLGRSRHERLLFSNDNMHTAYTMLGSNVNATQFFIPRATGVRYLESIPHSEVGVFEQSFFLFNGTDQAMENFIIAGDFTEERERDVNRITNPFLSIGSVPSNRGILLTSDKSDTAVSGVRATLYPVFELRLPVWKLRMSYDMSVSATSGSVYLQAIRRY